MAPRTPRRLRAPAVLMALALLTACGNAGAQERDPLVVAGSLGAADVASFQAVATAFEADTGIPVRYRNSNDLEDEIASQRNKPDIAIIGNPGIVRRVVERGLVAPLEDDIVDEASLLPTLREVGVRDGRRYGVPLQVLIGSLVWYPRQAFEAAGYEVPDTYAQLAALTERIKADGVNPWCIGVESAQETGWVFTDWIEQLLLDSAGPQAFDRWVEGELPFTSPEVADAASRFAELILGEANAYGGPLNILTTPVPDAVNPMIDLDPPGCYLLRQGNTLATTLPDDVGFGADIDIFPFPPVDPQRGATAFVTVDTALLVSPGEDAEELLAFLASPEVGERWLQASPEDDFLSPHLGFGPEHYTTDVARKAAEILAAAALVREDGSLQLPYRVGRVAFHTEMIDWVYGRQNLASTLERIDDAARGLP